MLHTRPQVPPGIISLVLHALNHLPLLPACVAAHGCSAVGCLQEAPLP